MEKCHSIDLSAVEGMEVKPLIDMMAAVESLEDARGLVPALERGWATNTGATAA